MKVNHQAHKLPTYLNLFVCTTSLIFATDAFCGEGWTWLEPQIFVSDPVSITHEDTEPKTQVTGTASVNVYSSGPSLTFSAHAFAQTYAANGDGWMSYNSGVSLASSQGAYADVEAIYDDDRYEYPYSATVLVNLSASGWVGAYNQWGQRWLLDGGSPCTVDYEISSGGSVFASALYGTSGEVSTSGGSTNKVTSSYANASEGVDTEYIYFGIQQPTYWEVDGWACEAIRWDGVISYEMAYEDSYEFDCAGGGTLYFAPSAGASSVANFSLLTTVDCGPLAGCIAADDSEINASITYAVQ